METTPPGNRRRARARRRLRPRALAKLAKLAALAGWAGAGGHLGGGGPLLPPPAAGKPLVFENGKDVFGRLADCRACHFLLNNLRAGLQPRLERMLEKDRVRKAGNTPAARRVDFGKYDTAISDAVVGACNFMGTFEVPELRKVCRRTVEDHEDGLVDLWARWAKLGPAEREGWNWNEAVCLELTGLCPPDLGRRRLAEFDDDGSGQAAEDKRYRSEPVPATEAEALQGHVHKLVAVGFSDVVFGDKANDLLIYFAFPAAHPAFHAAFWPTFAKLADLLAERGASPKGVKLMTVDAELNDVPPPYGPSIDGPKVLLVTPKKKTSPVFMTRLDEGNVPMYDLLYMIARSSKNEGVARAAVDLMKETDHDTLYKGGAGAGRARPLDDATPAVDPTVPAATPLAGGAREEL